MRDGMIRSSAAAARRGARLGLIPCAFVVAQFVLGLASIADADLEALQALMGPVIAAAIALVCLRAGAGEAERGSAWRARLLAGAVAGLLSVALVQLVTVGLEVADAGFGITRFVLGLQGDLIPSGMIPGPRAAAAILGPWTTFAAVPGVLSVTGGLLGAGLAALGTPLHALDERRARALESTRP